MVDRGICIDCIFPCCRVLYRWNSLIELAITILPRTRQPSTCDSFGKKSRSIAFVSKFREIDRYAVVRVWRRLSAHIGKRDDVRDIVKSRSCHRRWRSHCPQRLVVTTLLLYTWLVRLLPSSPSLSNGNVCVRVRTNTRFFFYLYIPLIFWSIAGAPLLTSTIYR